MSAAARPIVVCLAVLALALLFVGVVSGTVLRHVVQILPIAVALAITARRPEIGATASIPIFAFWTLIVLLIWSFLLGLSSIANGTYTVAEIVATFVMAGSSVSGLAKSVAASRGIGIAARVTFIGGFALAQIAALAVSMTRAVATR